MLKRILFCFIMLSVSVSCFAHPGRTDAAGGHKDNRNVSGLGAYHYHHGQKAHLHPDGKCPYDSYDNKEEEKEVEISSEKI